jgi:hypothetical protein
MLRDHRLHGSKTDTNRGWTDWVVDAASRRVLRSRGVSHALRKRGETPRLLPPRSSLTRRLSRSSQTRRDAAATAAAFFANAARRRVYDRHNCCVNLDRVEYRNTRLRFGIVKSLVVNIFLLATCILVFLAYDQDRKLNFDHFDQEYTYGYHIIDIQKITTGLSRTHL